MPNRDKSLDPFNNGIDPPDPEWLDPPRPCGHEWRYAELCMDCLTTKLDSAAAAAALEIARNLSAIKGEDGTHVIENLAAIIRSHYSGIQDDLSRGDDETDV